jgi:mannose-6-phosphate isomerase-like protein (cupin superfamily)
LIRVAAAACAVAVLAAIACARAPEPKAAEASRHVSKVEPAPHDGGGDSTAYRYFDDVPDARVIFRKRALHKGSAIGMHVLTHDEVYYVVSGRGRLRVDDRQVELGPSTAVFMHEGADVGIWQQGDEELVLIVAYPPAATP